MSLFNLIPKGVLKAGALALGRHAISTVTGALGVYLAAHYADQSEVANITQGVSTALLGLLSYGLSLYDVHTVDSKIKVALATPSPAAMTDAQEKEETALLNKLETIHPGGS